MRQISKKRLVDLALELITESPLAYHVTDGKRHAWLPKSQCEYDEDTGTFTMDVRLAEEKELI